MKQLVRRVIDRTGKVRVIELPEPHVGPDQALIQTHYSLISSGTELATLAKTPMELARQTITDPWMRHVVKQTVLATGLGQTARRIWQELVKPREIGYSGSGRVLAVGDGVDGLRVGDKVAYAASGHAELVAPSVNHVVPVPEAVDLRHAAFVTVGGIVIQALRRAEVQFGETVAVYGLGLLGQLCARVAKAAGCVVIGIDLDESRNRLARDAGVDCVVNPDDPEWKRRILDFTDKHGADATIICAASESETIINASMEITRRQGRVVIVGYVKLHIHPKNFLHREIDLRYSRAYGPGSYHRGYEAGRLDYPFSYVRWTEQRNLREFIRLLETRAFDLEPMIAGVYPLSEAQGAFDAIRGGTLGGVAALLRYDADREPDRRKTLEVRPRPKQAGAVGIAIIGCGNHVLATHLPNLRRMKDVQVRGLASATGRNAALVAKSVGATIVTTDVAEVLRDPGTDGVLICSSQPEHYRHVRLAVEAGKSVYVEKPLVTLPDDFERLARLLGEKPVLVTLGLNRRYSPLVDRMREWMQGPAESVSYIVTLPFVPPDHWSLDEVEGGGRLVSEGEHFIDLCHLLIGRPPVAVYARALGTPPDDLRRLSAFALTIHYEGAVANIVVDESGAADFPRERVTVLGRGRVAVLDDFAHLRLHGHKSRTYGNRLRREMGHREALQEFVAALRGEPNRLMTWADVSLATTCMFAAQESIRSGEPVHLRSFLHPAHPGESA